MYDRYNTRDSLLASTALDWTRFSNHQKMVLPCNGLVQGRASILVIQDMLSCWLGAGWGINPDVPCGHFLFSFSRNMELNSDLNVVDGWYDWGSGRTLM